MTWVHQHLPFAQHLTLAQVDDAIQQAAGGSLALKRVGNGVIALLTMLLVAFYFIVDGRRAFDWFVSLFPKTRQPRIRRTFSRGGRRMQRWLAGQGLLMLAHGASAMIVFGAIHLRYFYILGVFAGIINIIPVLGPIITLLVAGLVASIDSLTKLIAVILFYLVYHSLENAFLNPRIMESKVKIPAVTVVIALVIGDGLAGIVGILISVPTAVLVSVVINEYLASDQPDQSTVPRRAA